MSRVAVVLLFGLAVTFLGLCGTAGAATYSQDFTAADGTTDLGDGTTIASTDGTNSVQGNALRMTEVGTFSTRSSFRIPPLADSSKGFTATIDFTLDHTGGPNTPADGFTFDYGAIPPYDAAADPASPQGNGQAEEGWGAVDHIAFEVDTWFVDDQVNQDPGPGISSNVGGTRTQLAHTRGTVVPTGESRSGTATMTWDPVNGATFTTTGMDTNADYVNVAVPGFVGDDSYGFGISTRTGGHSETLIIDNVSIVTVPEPAALTLFGFAGVAFGLFLLGRRK